MDNVGEIAQFVAPCDEVAAFRAGAVFDNFSCWGLVIIAKRQGKVSLVTISREAFIARLAGSANVPLDIAEINRNMNEHLAKTGAGITANISGMHPMGVTKQAFFGQGNGATEIKGKVVPVNFVLAATTVK